MDGFDLSQLPEFFITDTSLIEDAGGGCLRLIKCVKRGGMLIPVISIVRPAENLIEGVFDVRDRVRQVLASKPRMMSS